MRAAFSGLFPENAARISGAARGRGQLMCCSACRTRCSRPRSSGVARARSAGRSSRSGPRRGNSVTAGPAPPSPAATGTASGSAAVSGRPPYPGRPPYRGREPYPGGLPCTCPRVPGGR